MYIIVDVETHTDIEVEITKENVGDQNNFIPLVQSTLINGLEVKQVQGDGIFATKEIHNFLTKNKLVPGIPPRNNASRKSCGCAVRAEEIRLYQDYGDIVWKLIRQYHLRLVMKELFRRLNNYLVIRLWQGNGISLSMN